jgi:hypothetical protein
MATADAINAPAKVRVTRPNFSLLPNSSLLTVFSPWVSSAAATACADVNLKDVGVIVVARSESQTFRPSQQLIRDSRKRVMPHSGHWLTAWTLRRLLRQSGTNLGRRDGGRIGKARHTAGGVNTPCHKPTPLARASA